MGNVWPPSTFLGQLRPDTAEAVLEIGTPVIYPAHRWILRQGEEGSHVILLVSGFVKVLLNAETGYEMLAAVRVGGDLVGEMAAFESRPRSGSVIACGEVRARVVQREALEQFLAARPDALRGVIRMLSARLRWANQRRVEFQAYDAETRLARVLVELSHSYGLTEPGRPRSVLALTLTQSELASLAGLKLATAEKALAGLTRIGLVERNYRSVTVNDVPRLMQFAHVDPQNPY
ncbi:Crp/Fnr family transcriptional regulator [Streptacidiphilus jiangxiensis]|uniref:cAMP-binding domain of CRP or a regulatory subunit of cAMP-dependent protein kinases n=1 Tax=Streptacidiphilus jiangxiensis TaxID=235985 RepID=A0A1H7J7F8_STRJI|nr:Crp/Fnr family transcriptional regulator [Streptacidiphilus jiangxiensis]SEK69085.1 cAMP-binding domain of CRP or a regulatory subunit of cAMP-dependent protein kinases [Streptacidiphilus jiangxiensis]